MTNQTFQKMTVTFNNHYLAIKMLKEAFAAYIEVLRKYMAFYDFIF